MKLSRREFVGGSAACASGFCVPGVAGVALAGAPTEADCIVFDLGANCVLPESLQGYREALNAEVVVAALDARRWQHRSGLVIVPGAGIVNATEASVLLELLDGGTTVLLESGGAFLDPKEMTAQQQMLRTFFDLSVLEPVELWSDHQCAPYVQYHWPREIMVRDFSRAIPVVAPGAETIGRLDGLQVAIKKLFGNGLLIFLGSPLGPALRAGDREARAWLQALAAAI